ncbi:glycosyltransferase domain-containing protein, partial [Bradyrhizobium sp.]|uniref:glycosyltransferase domain-containing protein n=1 Tax=Bradyrhizobium sp. TaxID=376 RepID=UPI0035202B56
MWGKDPALLVVEVWDRISAQAFERGPPWESFLRRVVYTCLFGHSELFNDFRYERNGVDFVCFTDDPELRSDFWEIRLLPRQLLDPARAAKRIKALPHIYLQEYDWSLYIDNTVRLKAAPNRIFDEYLAPAGSPMVCFRHFERDCVYEEAETVICLRLDTAERVDEQMALYKHLKYPARNGLAKGTFLLRRHHHPALLRPMNTWWEQISVHSRRDQLSLLPVCWFEGFEIEYMPVRFEMYELLDWPVLRDGRRLPRDFDEAVYLKLNPDLADIG